MAPLILSSVAWVSAIYVGGFHAGCILRASPVQFPADICDRDQLLPFTGIRANGVHLVLRQGYDDCGHQ